MPTFQRNILFLSSMPKDRAHLSPEDGDSMFLHDVGLSIPLFTAPKPRTPSSSSTP
jgi:hypothetical protein